MVDVVVIGAGASGLLASGFAAARGLSVLLLEKNDRPGMKLRITGKGRCNVTNDSTVREVLDNIPTGGKFLQSAVNGFTPKDTILFFEKLGVPLKTERGNRVFPVSDKAQDIVAALVKFAERSGAVLRQGTAKSVLTDAGCVSGVTTESEKIACRAVIICTGGLSYPLTGSTGDGYAFASAVGHTIVAPKPSLVPLTASPDICSRMQGLTLKNVRLTVRSVLSASGQDATKKPVFEDLGEMLFTHFGVSGPLVLSASAHMREFNNKAYTLSIDLKPALDDRQLDMRLLRDFEKYANKDFANALSDLAARAMIPVLVALSGISPETKVHSVTREQRQRLLGLFKDFRLPVIGPRPVAEAIITSGGIDTRELNPKTMESKRIRNLHFAGEVIDADAYTGGFNLQIAWSTAYAAAAAILPNV
jgi:predicted Rossmann fold flavoprotein